LAAPRIDPHVPGSSTLHHASAPKEFVRRVEKAFESDTSILATIPMRGGGDFIDKIRRRKDVEPILVTRENRDELPE
jgi:nucleoside-triphosphatase THEP1